jgi:hypothetical protein
MKTILKLIFIFLFIGAVISCNKTSNSGSGYYLKAKFDGTAKTFNTQVLAAKVNLGTDMYSLTISGIGNSEEGVLSLWSDKDDFTAGKTFTIDALGGTTKNIFGYTSPLGSSDPANIWSSTYDFGSVNESLTCTITEATSVYIKGTFSTVIYEQNDTAVISKTVTEGQFYAKF